MKSLVVLIGLAIIGLVGWRVGSRMSPDAVGLATGVVFGVLAGLPTALLILASNRRGGHGDDEPRGRQRQGGANGYPYVGHPQQPPVIVLASPTAAPPPAPQAQYEQPPEVQNNVMALPAPREERQFRVFGDTEDIVEDDFRA